MNNIREVQFEKPRANDDVVLMLEQWVERARSGEVQVIGLIGVKPDGTVSTEWRGLSGGGKHELISGISILQHRILQVNVEPET